MSAIEVIGLKKSFGAKEVLREVNLTVERGEIFGFLGRNGAGKSTFIQIMTGITQATGGTVALLGEPADRLDAIKQRIGVMPDTSNLYHDMTARAFLNYMAGLSGVRITKQEIGRLLEQVGLSGTERQKIGSFSFGMKKKISIAQALTGNPELLFLDEPTSGLDPESAIEIQRLLLALKADGKTIFLTSHNLNEIEKMCDRVAIMAEGRIVRFGTVASLQEAMRQEIQIRIRTAPRLETSHLPAYARLLSQAGDCTRLDLSMEEDIPELLVTLAKQDVKVYEVQIERQSLEEIFLAV
ncbi:ABC transporter ATP-binding protein [Exiguobacterium indicum]|uniref:ABC transporter ATP-binding protein n=1 Tax=Exiguobacterium indicum TaxID=296995 RepID=A0ABU8ELY6_9BACL|nr:ABC transporter ATP-binding protein [Exiguobacterium sp. JMULE1]NTY09368.1 ABC transporter ATP-binding protein [Exiguobacterium sp. JMULE1]